MPDDPAFEGHDPIIVPTEIKNFEARNYLMRLRDLILQIIHSQSQGVSFETEDDIARIEGHMTRLATIWGIITGEEMDCPWLQPQDFPVISLTELQHFKNIDLLDIASSLGAWYQELGRCDSSRTGGAFSAKDRARGDDFIKRINLKLTVFKGALDSDDPESPDSGDLQSTAL
jgi:hypothetical protein